MRVFSSLLITSLWLLALLPLRAEDDQLTVDHADCTFFGAKRERFLKPSRRDNLTSLVTHALGAGPKGQRLASFAQSDRLGLIDSHLFSEMQAAGVKPAEKTNDFEFIRRVTLDLTGRIPAPERVLQFAADTSSDKRARLIDELLATDEYVDRWTMYFGDLFKNSEAKLSTAVRTYPKGRNALYSWIRGSLASNKPYHQMAGELIIAEADDSYIKGEVNWLVGGVATGGPVQDILDQQAANVAETFLGLGHMNCILCHNGRGHLDSLSLWGMSATRYQAWQFAAFLSHTNTRISRREVDGRAEVYWSVLDNIPRDYQLGSTTGNRPARTPLATCAAGRPCYVAPQYPFSGRGPAPGESYRIALAREITEDFQFARATVNYIWAEFFVKGIVEPVNQFDLARLDPEHPPPDPWKLQPTNARLLHALASRFIESGYNLKSLMREITNSEAYQMSSRYNGAWNPEWEKLFARKLVRRLWAEEIHDAVVQSSGVLPTYNVAGFSDAGYPSVTWAMKLPDTLNMPGGAVGSFLDGFLRGNRDDNERRQEGSVLQALNLMNDPLVTSRLQPTGPNANQLLANHLAKPDAELVSALYLGVLSRYPSDNEKAKALAALKSGNRTQSARNLLWTLYNKVDFIFNY